MPKFKCVECKLRHEEADNPPIEVRNKYGYPELYCYDCYLLSTEDVTREDKDFLKDWDNPASNGSEYD